MYTLCALCVRLPPRCYINVQCLYVCVCIMFTFGADGQVLVFDVANVVPEPGQPLFDRRLKLVYQKEHKTGPVTALAEMHGMLAATIGQEVYLFTLEDNTLNSVAFLHLPTYATALCAFKSYLVVGDLVRSVAFVRLKVCRPASAMPL
jgi:cleavage and polyadenylation specificity factor subunit 1